MLVVKKCLDITIDKKYYEMINIDKKNTVFFDIETTGFISNRNHIYLIGCIYYFNNKLNLIQWLSNSIDEELKVIKAFLNFISNYNCICHYNGTSFDLPFINNKCKLYKINNVISNKKSFDLYSMIRPFKKVFNLNSLKLKDIEKHINYNRLDNLSGKELIKYYFQFIKNNNENIKNLLLLHNEDDMKGLLYILPLLQTTILLTSNFYKNYIVKHTSTHIIITFNHSFNFYIDFYNALNGYKIYISNNKLELFLPVFKGELKHFFKDYKNYYYLPIEDQAIHKSVGIYVENEHRQKATAYNCYIKKRGHFIPLLTKVDLSLFKINLKETMYYVQVKDLLEDEETLIYYFLFIVKKLIK